MNLAKIFLPLLSAMVVFALVFLGIKEYSLASQHQQEFKELAEKNYAENKGDQMKANAKNALINEPKEAVIKYYNNTIDSTKEKWSKLKGWYSKKKDEYLSDKEQTPEKTDITTIKQSDDNSITVENTDTIADTKDNTIKERPTVNNSEIKQSLDKNTYIYFGVLVGGMLMLLLFWKFNVVSVNFVVFMFLTFSLISWFIGVISPMLTIEVYKDLPVLGYTVLKYDSKGVIDTITKLIESNVIVAICIGAFSIIIPIFKTVLMYVSLYSNKSFKVLDKIGKWSMLDVFVVAVLLSVFALDSDEFTEAKVQAGLYFFTAYVILSVWASHLITSRKEHISKHIFFK